MEETKKRKRGRPKKNTQKVNKISKKKKIQSKSKKYSILDTQKPQPQKVVESVLIHLPIDIKKFQKEDTFFDNEFQNYDPNLLEPQPYDPKTNDNNDTLYQNIVINNKDDKIENKNEYNIHNKNEFINKKVKEIMVQFDDFNKIKQWPHTIDIKCWWCCHNFDSTPCGIPIKYENESFYVMGCFCSFNCALSYNFNTKIDKKWERAGLIKLLHNKIFNVDEDIEYAPNRECLKDFGGYMTIDEFRKNMSKLKYNINYPPMLSIIPQIEEVKIIKETNRENDFQEKLNLVSEKMKLKNRQKNKKSLSRFLKTKVNKVSI